MTNSDGIIHIPAASIGALLLGPGTRATHAAISLLGDAGASAIWVGENGVRFYASGRPLSRNSKLLISQAKLVSSNRSRLAVARKMYGMRFPDEVVDRLSMQQLRGKEGARVRQIYREHATRTGINWERRNYRPGAIQFDDHVNQALTAGASCLYGIVHAVVAALGCAPGLGFVHNGSDRAFVYDIADLYRAEIVIPAAFDVAAGEHSNPTSEVRRAVRDAVVSNKLLARAANDISTLLRVEPDLSLEWIQDESVSLWSAQGNVAAGVNYGAAEEMPIQ